MHLFFTPDIAGDTHVLSEEESRHAVSVLRLKEGSSVILVDGKGGYYEAQVLEAHPKRTRLQVLKHIAEYGKRDYRIHLAVAPTKNSERFEWFLEKATEIGVDEVTPLICQRSERREVKVERLNRVATSAMKQSVKAYHPQINPAVPFSKIFDLAADEKYIAHCMEGQKSALSDRVKAGASYLVLIGPEGDFTSEELAAADAAGFEAISLGNSRLRTETAALYACFELNFLNR